MMVFQPPVMQQAEGGPTILIVGTANGAAMAEEAAAAMGGRIAARLDWDEAPRAIAGHAGRAVLAIEAEGAPEDVLMAALPRLDAAAAALDMPVVIAIGVAAIDVAAASLVDAQAQLLCEPTLVDRVIAIALASHLEQGALADSVREGEAARLQRLNDEVARIADVLSKLTRREPDRVPSPMIGEHPSPFRQIEADPDIVIDAAEVRRAIRARRLRDQHFGSGLFEDPAWEILLDLFAAELERVQVSVSSLCIAASVAPTTALRWIAKLTEAGLLERHPDPFDRRRAFMELSPRAGRAMREHVAALRRAGLPFG